MTLTPELLGIIERRCAAVVAQGGVWLDGRDGIRARDVLELVSVYRKAQDARRQGLYAIKLHDMQMIRNVLNYLPEGSEAPRYDESLKADNDS